MVSQATVTATTHTFTAADGITASTTYVCTAALVMTNSTSAESQPVVLTTPAVTGNDTINQSPVYFYYRYILLNEMIFLLMYIAMCFQNY